MADRRAGVYSYFDFRLDVTGEPLIHPRRNCVVVIRVLDLHDALHCVSLFAEHEAGKETERKKREREKKKRATTKNSGRSRAALRIHSANDITRPRTSSRCDTLTFPHRDSRDFKDPVVLASPSNFTVLRKSERNCLGPRAIVSDLRETRHFRRRVFSRDAMHGRVRRKGTRQETKRSTDGTQLAGAAGPPNASRACAGSGTLVSG